MENLKKPSAKISLLLVGILVTVGISAGFAYKTKADTIIQMILAGNSAPSIESVIVSTEYYGPQVEDVTLAEGVQTSLYVYGTILDQNGCLDHKRVLIRLYRADLGESCALDTKNCYEAEVTAFTSCAGSGDTTAHYNAIIPLESYAEPTDAGSPYEATNWVAKATVWDQEDGTDADFSPGFEINSLAGLGVTSSLEFGQLQLGEISQPKVVYMTNYGNRTVVPYCVAEGDFICSSGDVGRIESTQLHMNNQAQINEYLPPVQDDRIVTSDKLFDFTDEQRQAIWSGGLPMASDETLSYYEGIPPSDGTDNSVLPVYFTLKVPESGVEGGCMTIMRVTAVAQ